MRLVAIFLFLLVIVCSTAVSASDDGWSFEFLAGIPYNLSTALIIDQGSGNQIYLDRAQYSSKPFESPIYYSFRISRWRENKALEIELLHHKLYLENNPGLIQHFEISHGYNLITANRAWRNKEFIFRIGVGAVLAHPDIIVNDKTLSYGGIFNTGYFLTGPVLGASVARKTPLTEKVYLNTEGKITGAYARIPVDSGEALAPNIAFHLLFGLGYNF